MEIAELKILYFEDDGIIPNNPNLPVLLYRDALSGETDSPESVFERNEWCNSWRNGIFDYHHFHSNTHEVLGVIDGEAEVLVGGEFGETVRFQKGDVLILPAGTGHKRISASDDFKVAGAYPDGRDFNTKKGRTDDRTSSRLDIISVPLPSCDPVFGGSGPLIRHWRIPRNPSL